MVSIEHCGRSFGGQWEKARGWRCQRRSLEEGWGKLALTGMRGVVTEGRKSRRGQSKETGLHPRMATEGSEKGALQSGAKRRSLCKGYLEGGGWGNTMGLGGM